MVPNFLRHFQFNVQDGKFPFSGSDKDHLYGWVRYKQAPEHFGFAHLIGILDAWPPTVLQIPRKPTAASTISWNIEFIQPQNLPAPDQWIAFQDNTRQASHGYSHTDANIWNENGELIALSPVSYTHLTLPTIYSV